MTSLLYIYRNVPHIWLIPCILLEFSPVTREKPALTCCFIQLDIWDSKVRYHFRVLKRISVNRIYLHFPANLIKISWFVCYRSRTSETTHLMVTSERPFDKPIKRELIIAFIQGGCFLETELSGKHIVTQHVHSMSFFVSAYI